MLLIFAIISAMSDLNFLHYCNYLSNNKVNYKQSLVPKYSILTLLDVVFTIECSYWIVELLSSNKTKHKAWREREKTDGARRNKEEKDNSI